MKNNMFLSSKVTLTRGHKSVLFGTRGYTEYRFSGILKEFEISRKKSIFSNYQIWLQISLELKIEEIYDFESTMCFLRFLR